MAHPLPFILSIPHGGLALPPEVADYCALTEKEIFNDSDAFSREIYGMADAVLGEVTQEVARTVVDLNRPPGELPPTTLDGAIKYMTSFGGPVWMPGHATDSDFFQELLERHYYPYHRRLEALLEAHRSMVRLLIDCHTMAPVGPPIAGDAGKRRPLISLGNMGTETGTVGRHERTSLPSQVIRKLSHIMADIFARDIAALSPANPILLNCPFQGGYITQHYSSQGFWAVQVELSRDLYIHPKWFDSESRTVDEGRLRELNAKLRTTFAELAACIEKT